MVKSQGVYSHFGTKMLILILKKEVKILENRLKQVRQQAGLSLAEVGKGIGLATNTISRYETGKREPKLETWQKLADFFGVTVPYLQGLEPSWNEKVTKIRELVISKLNTFYFDKDANKLVKTLVPIENVKNAVDEYARLAKLMPLPNELRHKTNKQRIEYLNKYFSFLYEDENVFDLFYSYVYLDASATSGEQRVTNAKLANGLAKSIEIYTVQEFRTKLGATFNKKYGSELQKSFRILQRNISFCKSIEDVGRQFDSYIEHLKEIKNKSIHDYHEVEKDVKAFSTLSNLTQHDKALEASVYKTDSFKNIYEQMEFVKDYLVKNKKEVPKEINDYLEKYSNR